MLVNTLKKPLYLFDCGPNRYAFGALVKQKHALGNSQFWYCAAGYLQPATKYASASCAVTDNSGNIIDTYEWEQVREGVNDYRYMLTLEKAIANCEDQNSPEASAGRKLLEDIMKMKFKAFEGEINGVDVEYMSSAMTGYDGAELDRMRADLIRCISALHNSK